MTSSFIFILRRPEFVNSSVDNIRVLNWFQFPLERNTEIFTVTPSLTPSTTFSALLPIHLFVLSVFLPSLRLQHLQAWSSGEEIHHKIPLTTTLNSVQNCS